MAKILESIFKGFVQWLYGLGLEIIQYIANSLLDVFTMDLNYFRQVAPVTDDILSIVIAAGWALLLGNLVFQAVKSMASGLGFEGEDPKLLFTRTFVFAFLLLASPEICEIGLGISASVIELLQVPSSVTISLPEENYFNIGASWLLVVIVNFVIMWQIVKLFFEIAERYVVTAALVLLSPLAFATGGSKNTADIFKGWCRMFGSMCLMMVLNVVFLKLLISAMGHMPSDVGVLPWMLLIVGIARVARKADSIVARMGLNPAITGDGLGRGLPGMVAYAVVKSVGSTVAKTVAHSAGRSGSTGPRRSGGPAPGGRSTPPPAPPSGGGSGASRPAGNSAGGTSGTAGSSQGGTAPGNGSARPAAAYAQQNSTGTSTSSSVTNATVSNQQTQTVSGQGRESTAPGRSGFAADLHAARHKDGVAEYLPLLRRYTRFCNCGGIRGGGWRRRGPIPAGTTRAPAYSSGGTKQRQIRRSSSIRRRSSSKGYLPADRCHAHHARDSFWGFYVHSLQYADQQPAARAGIQTYSAKWDAHHFPAARCGQLRQG